jgi:hypothetical protein
MSDIIITPASGKIDFYQDLGAASLAKIELTATNDLALSTTSGNLIIGDASRDVYIGNGINDVDIIFEQNGEIRPLPSKTLNIGTSGSFTQILASKVNINQNSFTSIPLDVYSSTSGATILNVAGTKGALFSVTDNLSGSLMSVNNDAGLPVFEVFSDDRVVAGRFGQNDFIMTSGGNVGIGTGVPSSKFHVVGTSTFNGDVSSTGSFIAGSGSAALPSFEFINDVDTGLFSPTTNAFGISTSGVERLRIDSVGKVGIGTSNPAAPLHIFDPTTSSSLSEIARFGVSGVYTGNFRILAGSTSDRGGELRYYEGDTEYSRVNFDVNRIDFITRGAYPINFLTNNNGTEGNNQRMTITSAGNVGIGTSSPSSTLQVSGLITANSGNFTQSLQVNGTGVWHSGNFDSSNIVRTTGTQTISGVKTFSDGLKVVGNDAGVPIELGVSQDAIVLFGKTTNGLGIGSNSFNFSDSSTNVIDSRELLIGLNANNPILTISRGLLFAGNSGVGVINYYDNGGAISANRLIFDVTPATTLASANTTLRTTTADGNNIVLNLPNTSGTLALLTSINTTQITGTLPVNKGGTNITSYSNGQLLIGSGTSLVANTLSAGTGIAITNGSGTITINTSGLQTLLTNPVTGTGTGASTSGYLPRWNSTSGLSNSLIFDNGTSVGIGTVTPSGKLHVSGTIIASGGDSTNWNTAYGWGNHADAGYISNYIYNGITIFGGENSIQNIVFENDGSTVADITWDDPNDRLQINAVQLNINAENGLIVETDSPIQFNPNGGGNVGIGIVNPTSKLHVAGDILATGSFIGGSGTAALPSFEFVNDPDTGLFSPAANTFAISTSGVERLLVDNAGNVGIGNSYPNSKLDVRGTFACGTPGGDPDAGGQGLYLDPSVPSLTFNDISGPNTTLTINNDGLTLYDFVGSPFFYTDRNNARIGIGTAIPSSELQVSGLITANSGNFTNSLQLNGSGVGLYDTSVFNLGTISGTNAINCGQDRQIQTLTLNGVATTFTKGTGWPTSNSVARETTLNIFASGNTSVTWTIVNDWYRQPDSPLPSGRHIVLLRSVGSGTMQGHYIGNKTN